MLKALLRVAVLRFADFAGADHAGWLIYVKEHPEQVMLLSKKVLLEVDFSFPPLIVLSYFATTCRATLLVCSELGPTMTSNVPGSTTQCMSRSSI